MIKVLLFSFLMSCFAYGFDATMQIVKRNSYTPKVLIEDNTGLDISKTLKNKIYKLIVGDFIVSGHMKPQESQTSTSIDTHPDYKEIKKRKIDLVLKYKAFINKDKSLNIKMALFDINNNDVAYSKTYITSNKDRYPFLAHNITIDINNHLNAPSIDWMQRFVIFSKYTNPKESDIYVADYTLSFKKKVISKGLNIFPKWADLEQENFFYTKISDKPTLYKVNIYTGEQEKILSSDGMIVASDVSKDEKSILVTMAPNDQADIYMYNLDTKERNRITKYQGVDVAGNFVDNDEKIVFVSDRLGTPNIFAKSLNSNSIELFVHHGKNNNSVTTHNNYIVYVSRESKSDIAQKTFNLYLVSTKTDYIRALTSSGVNQFPKFSSDGESILFLKRYKRQSSLGIIRLNYNTSYLFPLPRGRIQSIDW